MPEEIEQYAREMPKFVQWVVKELGKEASMDKLKAFELAGLVIHNMAKKRLEEFEDGV